MSDLPQPPAGVDPLDDLFDEVMRLKPPTPAPKSRRAIRTALEESAKSRYTNPENWLRQRGIALIHAETQSLIGNYSEYRHRFDPRCRKLVLEEGPMTIDATEVIAGWEHLGERTREHLHAAERWTAEREIVFDLTLEPLGVHAFAVRLKVCFSFGGIVRVELMDETQLIAPEGNVIVTLPAGINVLEVMDLNAKIALRKELL